MVVTEPCPSSMWSATDCEDDESSGSSEPQKGSEDQKLKRKSNNAFNGDDDEMELKRRKNREAAKRCRDKKQQQTEELRKKNSELEKENCTLAKQRDELIRKCQEYHQEIEQHKQQGCVVPHFSPPYDLDQILNPPTPPSPSFSESMPSPNPSLSPAPSISPGPSSAPKHQPYLADPLPSAQVHCLSGIPNDRGSEEIDLLRANTPNASSSNSMPTTELRQAPAKEEGLDQKPAVHYIRVKNKDGSIKTLCLSVENYIKVMQRLKALKVNAAQQLLQNQRAQSPAESMVSATQPQQMMFTTGLQPHCVGDRSTNPSQQQMEVQEETPRNEQKLDTFDDLISVLQKNVRDPQRQYELVAVDPNEVLVKQEPVDSEYDQQSFMQIMQVKQEDADNTSDTSGQWISTGQQIRAGLDILTNQEEPSSSSHEINNLIQFLESEDQTFTVTVTDPRTDQVVEKATARPNFLRPAGSLVKQLAATDSSSVPNQRITYITSTSPVGSLGFGKTSLVSHQETTQLQQVKPQTTPIKPFMSLQNDSEQQHNSITISAMHNVKLRPNATQMMTSSVLQGNPQEVIQKVSSVARSIKIPQVTQRTEASQSGMSSTVVQQNMIPFSSANSQICTLNIPSVAEVKNLQQLSGTAGFQTSVSMVGRPDVTSQLQLPDTEDGLFSTTTSQVLEYLRNYGIETMSSSGAGS